MSIFDYIRDTRSEVKHVVWPNRKQALAYTAAIIIVSLALAVILGAFDYLFTQGIETFIQ